MPTVPAAQSLTERRRGRSRRCDQAVASAVERSGTRQRGNDPSLPRATAFYPTGSQRGRWPSRSVLGRQRAAILRRPLRAARVDLARWISGDAADLTSFGRSLPAREQRADLNSGQVFEINLSVDKLARLISRLQGRLNLRARPSPSLPPQTILIDYLQRAAGLRRCSPASRHATTILASSNASGSRGVLARLMRQFAGLRQDVDRITDDG